MQDKRKKVLVMSTGSKAVDAILGGGVFSQSITEGTPAISYNDVQ
jgi:meiotic recombination protein DMC1